MGMGSGVKRDSKGLNAGWHGPPLKLGGAIKKFQSPKPLGQEIMKEYMYTLKEIIDAWENNYGGDMEKDYPRFFKELKKAASCKLD